MDKDISKKSANDKGSERANGRSPGGDYQPLPSGPETEMLALHSAIGNQGVGRLLQPDGGKPGMIQAKLTVSQPGDRYEQEADRIADEVMRAPSNHVSGAPPSVTPIQTPSLQCDTISGRSTAVSPNVHTQIESLQRSGGEPLPESAQAFMQSRLGRDFSGVRVHRNSEANDLAGRLHAHAFTVGDHIVFGKGQYPVGNPVNSRLLTHELIHSLQQKESNQTLIQRELSTSQAEPVIELEAPEEGFQPLPDEDRIKSNSKLEKRLRRLARRMGMLMFNLFGDGKDDPDQTTAALIFSKSQLKIARQAGSSYRKITKKIKEKREKLELDTAYAAGWLDALISTLNKFSGPLREVANSRTEYAEIARTLHRQTREILESAKKLRDAQPFARGGALANKARASVVRRLQNEQKKAEQQRLIEESGLNQDLLALSQASDVELMILQIRAERVLQDVTDPETKARLQARIDQELKSREEIEQRGAPEPNLVSLKDKLTTVESQRTREGSADLLNRMDRLGLATLAEDPEGKARLANLGLRLAESTSFQAAGELVSSLIPAPESDVLGKIVTERWEEEKAIHRISRAIAVTGEPKEYILVADFEELTHLRITRSGDRIIVRKVGILPGIEAYNASITNTRTPKTEWDFSPSDLVGFTITTTGQSVSVPAFSLLYQSDTINNETNKIWAQLVALGVTLSKAPITSASHKLSASGIPPPSGGSVTPTRSITGFKPPQKALTAGREPKGALRVGAVEPKAIVGKVRTTPINRPNPHAGPSGPPKKVRKGASPGLKHGIGAENESALILAKNGFDVEQIRDIDGFPDLIITTQIGGRTEKRIFDVIAFSTSRVENIATRIGEKVSKGQVRLVLHLRSSTATLDEIRQELLMNPVSIEGLEEILAILPSGEVIFFWP